MAADLGMQVTLIEADKRLGGVCLLRGCIPSKALLHVARVVSDSRDMADWGLLFQPPAIDLKALRARKEKLIETLAGGLKQLAKQRRVNVVQARGQFQDSQTLALDNGEQITFDHCIVAVGSSPTKIPAFDLPGDRVMDSTGALDLADVPESLLVVGGGYIGLEMGTVYAELGSKVTVVELTAGLLPGADRDLVKPLHARIDQVVAEIFLNTKVVYMRAGARSKSISMVRKANKNCVSAACSSRSGDVPIARTSDSKTHKSKSTNAALSSSTSSCERTTKTF